MDKFMPFWAGIMASYLPSSFLSNEIVPSVLVVTEYSAVFKSMAFTLRGTLIWTFTMSSFSFLSILIASLAKI